LKIERLWGEDSHLPDFWSTPLEISQTRLQLIFKSKNISLDELGFRKHQSVSHLDSCEIIALGGSTTFGYYVEDGESWPAHFETITRRKVTNLAQVKGDIWTSIGSLTDKKRHDPGINPRFILTYDGVNQSSAFLTQLKRFERVTYQHPNFPQLQEILHGYRRLTTKKMSIEQIGYFLYGKRFLNWKLARRYNSTFDKKTSNEEILESSKIEAENYLTCLGLLRKISNSCFSAQVVAFLQPHLFCYWKGADEEHRIRKIYLDGLYQEILLRDAEVVDLRYIDGLTAENFFDWAHVNGEGNLIIANGVYKQLTKRGLDPR